MLRAYTCNTCDKHCTTNAKRGPLPARCNQCSRLAENHRKKTRPPQPRYRVACPVCKAVVFKPTKQRFCSQKCWRFERFGETKTTVLCSNPACGKTFERLKTQLSKCKKPYCSYECCRKHRQTVRHCLNCNKELVRRSNGLRDSCKFCSKECFFDFRWGKDRPRRKRKNPYAALTKLRKRCKNYGVPHDKTLSREMVLERDGYICQRCGISCNKEYKIGPGRTICQRNAEVDHIVPLSCKGSPGHVASNCQCLCRKCNMRKGASLQGDQMRLAFI